MPQAAYTPIPICKGMDQFELVMEYTAEDEHVYLAGFHPVQQFHCQIRDILRQSAKMQDMPFPVYYTHGPGAEHAGIFHQSPGHDAMSGQQIVHQIGIKFIKPVINFIGVLDLCNILGRSQDMLPIQYSSYLFQGKSVLLDGQRTIYTAILTRSPIMEHTLTPSRLHSSLFLSSCELTQWSSSQTSILVPA